jgi:hypothetical protein
MSYRRHSCDSGFSGSAEVAVVEQKVQALAAAWARVLLVEDEVDIRELIRYSLAQAGLDEKKPATEPRRSTNCAHSRPTSSFWI